MRASRSAIGTLFQASPASTRRALSTHARPLLPLSSLTAVSAIDGRYARQTAPLRSTFSEYALIKQRVIVEIEWLRVLAETEAITEVRKLSPGAEAALDAIVASFDERAAARVKEIEAATNHDVKAVEYYLKEAFDGSASSPELRSVAEFLHFAATSEDVNNLAYARMAAEARAESVLPGMRALVDACVRVAGELADAPMLSRTHGQPATPTTMGKEWANWAVRLARHARAAAAVPIEGKFNGAVGSFNAHVTAYPHVAWPALAQRLVEGRLGLVYAPYSTQIECHDWMAELFHAVSRFNTVLLDLDRDVWGYISLGYFKQRTVAGEIGSSTMPHKVNPIDFENSEGNVGLSNAILGHCADKLPVSRFQRDLSDSTVLRAIGSGLGHALIAYSSTLKGIGKLQADAPAMARELDAHWEVLAEPIQTVMRRHGAPKPYEQLKELTRGRGAFAAPEVRAFVQRLRESGQLPADAADALAALTPASYTGIAADLARGVGAHTRW